VVAKRVSIIGAGISGLTAGIYLRMNGFEVHIFEKHAIPGGLCTSWEKGEYTFDSCAHWILGSDTGSSFHKIWNEIVDMKSIEFHNHDVRVEIGLKNSTNKYGEKSFKLYTNLAQLESYMIDLAPEDEKQIKAFIKPMRIMQKFDLPPILDDLPPLQSAIRGIKMMRYLEFLWWFLKLKNFTNYTYARKFKNPFLREAFELMYDGEEINMMVLTMPLSVFDKKSAGYPIGGSMKFAKRIEQSFIKLGGIIHYNTPVKKVVTENNEAIGLLVRNNVVHTSDLFLSAADWNFTAFEALEGKYIDEEMKKLRAKEGLNLFYSVMQFSFGINKDLSSYPHFFRVPLNEPIESPDGTRYERFEVHIYNYDPTLAPKGKTSLTVSYSTNNRNFWIEARAKDRPRYRAAKLEFTEKIIDRLDKLLGGIKEHIEVIDVATPATFKRYTGNWEGSTQGWMPGKNLLAPSPVGFKFPNLKRFYYSSHWNQPGGGLPIAIKTGRDVAKLICKESGVKFKVSPII
jgi:phytoene dehydrogenase-like protein